MIVTLTLRALGLGFDALDLVVVAVDEREPGAAVFGVAPVGFVEDAADHGGGGFDDAGGQPLVGRDRSRRGLSPAGRSWARMSAAVRGAGVASYTAPISAIRLWLSFSAADSRVLGFGPARARAGGGLGAQRVGAHHDPLAVGREHQQLVRFGPLRSPGLVEVLEVDRGELRQLLDLALPEPLPGRALDRLDRVLEAAAGRLQRRELAQPVGVTLDRQVQRRVGGMQVRRLRRPIRQPRDRHRPEHRLQARARDPARPDRGHPLIADTRSRRCSRIARSARWSSSSLRKSSRPSRSRRSSSSACERPAASVPSRKQTSDSNCSRLRRNPAASSRSPLAAGVALAAGAAASLPTRLTGRTSSTGGVKFARTGVEIGGHVGHLRGRRCT